MPEMCLGLQKLRRFRYLPYHLEYDHYCIILLSAGSPSFITSCRFLPFLLQIQINTETRYAEEEEFHSLL